MARWDLIEPNALRTMLEVSPKHAMGLIEDMCGDYYQWRSVLAALAAGVEIKLTPRMKQDLSRRGDLSVSQYFEKLLCERTTKELVEHGLAAIKRCDDVELRAALGAMAHPGALMTKRELPALRSKVALVREATQISPWALLLATAGGEWSQEFSKVQDLALRAPALVSQSRTLTTFELAVLVGGALPELLLREEQEAKGVIAPDLCAQTSRVIDQQLRALSAQSMTQPLTIDALRKVSELQVAMASFGIFPSRPSMDLPLRVTVDDGFGRQYLDTRTAGTSIFLTLGHELGTMSHALMQRYDEAATLTLQRLIAAGHLIDEPSHCTQRYAAHAAAQNGNTTGFALLASHGCDITARDNSGLTPARLAPSGPEAREIHAIVQAREAQAMLTRPNLNNVAALP